ncbi:MAG: class A beta-lactamase-related serine hydrolase [Cytophagaceae bacterium]|jgi:hypothetical protein|nr:class A beta-lactamase-related serine hydrolase [Cytophagaceae bacterium]
MLVRLILLVWFAGSGLQAQRLLDSLLKADTHAVVKKVLTDPDKYRLQIHYTQVVRKHEQVTLYHHSFRPKADEYFYPASLVKLPAAALALEKLNWLAPEGVHRQFPLRVVPPCASAKPDTVLYPSLEENIKRMLVMSDNPSFNNIYDFLGQEYIQLRLASLGYPRARMIQRLCASSTNENKTTGPFALTDSTGKPRYQEEAITCSKSFPCPLPNALVGKAYVDGRKIMPKPKDFSESNYIPLSYLHHMLISIMLPEAMPDEQRFELSGEQLSFLKQCMGAYPRESGIADYVADTNLYDAVRKYILFGNEKGTLGDGLRSYNKVGLAYGFVSDVAYICDSYNQVEYFVSCVLYTNDNEILNDGKYEYRSIAFPFLKQLGRILLDYEVKQKSK